MNYIYLSSTFIIEQDFICINFKDCIFVWAYFWGAQTLDFLFFFPCNAFPMHIA
jgi:hypothetical protein